MKKRLLGLNDEYMVVNLPDPFYDTEKVGREDFTGMWILQLFYSVKLDKCFCTTYSIWDDGKGRCVGEKTKEITPSALIHYSGIVGVDLPDEFVNKHIIDAE